MSSVSVIFWCFFRDIVLFLHSSGATVSRSNFRDRLPSIGILTLSKPDQLTGSRTNSPPDWFCSLSFWGVIEERYSEIRILTQWKCLLWFNSYFPPCVYVFLHNLIFLQVLLYLGTIFETGSHHMVFDNAPLTNRKGIVVFLGVWYIYECFPPFFNGNDRNHPGRTLSRVSFEMLSRWWCPWWNDLWNIISI